MKKKLRLNRETMRALQPIELSGVAGGDASWGSSRTTIYYTREAATCPIVLKTNDASCICNAR